MELLSANQAKTQFGELLMKAQQAPVQINKNGKPVAVVISIDEFERMEKMKLRLLQFRFAQAKTDVINKDTLDGELFFDELESGQHDQ